MRESCEDGIQISNSNIFCPNTYVKGKLVVCVCVLSLFRKENEEFSTVFFVTNLAIHVNRA